MEYLNKFLVVGLVALLSASCASTGSTVSQKRQSVLDMRQDVLSELYERKPDVRAQIHEAAGYGVFSSANVHLIYLGGTLGRGVVENNRTGELTYMKMGSVDAGLGLGAKDYRMVIVFHDDDTLQRFVTDGWSFRAEGDAAAKASEQGGAVSGAGSTGNMTIYQFTESGLSLKAVVSGTRYWPDEELN